MQWSKSFDLIFKKQVTFYWFSFIDLLTVYTIYKALAKVACDDFVTCPATPAMAKEVAFSTQTSTKLKPPWTLHQLTGFKLTRNDCVLCCLQILLRTSKKKEQKKKTSRSQKVDFDLFYFCYCHCDDWVSISSTKMKWLVQYSQSFLLENSSNTMREKLLQV